jgi:hypothetical protein
LRAGLSQPPTVRSIPRIYRRSHSHPHSPYTSANFRAWAIAPPSPCLRQDSASAQLDPTWLGVGVLVKLQLVHLLQNIFHYRAIGMNLLITDSNRCPLVHQFVAQSVEMIDFLPNVWL